MGEGGVRFHEIIARVFEETKHVQCMLPPDPHGTLSQIIVLLF